MQASTHEERRSTTVSPVIAPLQVEILPPPVHSIFEPEHLENAQGALCLSPLYLGERLGAIFFRPLPGHHVRQHVLGRFCSSIATVAAAYRCCWWWCLTQFSQYVFRYSHCQSVTYICTAAEQNQKADCEKSPTSEPYAKKMQPPANPSRSPLEICCRTRVPVYGDITSKLRYVQLCLEHDWLLSDPSM